MLVGSDGQLTPFGGFDVNDCPLDVILYNSLDTVCRGQTIGLYADALNASGPVTYTWAPLTK